MSLSPSSSLSLHENNIHVVIIRSWDHDHDGRHDQHFNVGGK